MTWSTTIMTAMLCWFWGCCDSIDWQTILVANRWVRRLTPFFGARIDNHCPIMMQHFIEWKRIHLCIWRYSLRYKSCRHLHLSCHCVFLTVIYTARYDLYFYGDNCFILPSGSPLEGVATYQILACRLHLRTCHRSFPIATSTWPHWGGASCYIRYLNG